jgi:hypothetical protein
MNNLEKRQSHFVSREDRERYDIPHVDEIQKQKIEKEQENERQVFVNKVKQR